MTFVPDRDPRVAAVKKIVKRDKEALVREVDGGGAEVVSIHRGRVARHYVDSGGTSMLVARGDRSRILVLGWVVVASGWGMLPGSAAAPSLGIDG
jgi:hypothetical protein